MLYSEAKEWDVKMRSEALDQMKVLIDKYAMTKDPYWMERAKWWGKQSELYNARINNHDYLKEDGNCRRVDEILRKSLIVKNQL